MTLRNTIQEEFSALYDIRDLFPFKKLKDFWGIINFEILHSSYEIFVGFTKNIHDLICRQEKFIQRFAPM